jgi:hypothetical protein
MPGRQLTTMHQRREESVYAIAPLLCIFLELFVFPAETLDPTGCIHQFLLAGKKGMALGTDFNTDVRFGRSHFNGAATGTFNGRILVFGMDICFHF